MPVRIETRKMITSRIELDYQWTTIREELNKAAYFFPNPLTPFIKKEYAIPAIYRWTVNEHLEECNIVYVGETVNLVNRLKGYLKPGPSQTTNIRMKANLDKYVASSYAVRIQIMKIHNFSFNSRAYTNDLYDMSLRRLIENFLIQEHKDQKYIILNAQVKECNNNSQVAIKKELII